MHWSLVVTALSTGSGGVGGGVWSERAPFTCLFASIEY